MKNLIFPFLVVVLFFTSCSGKNNQAANNMATEMCKAMELIKAEDPMSMIEAASAMTTIAEKTDLYGQVTNEQLIAAMKKICPDGAKKYIEISEGAEESTSK
jgi:hypothetical protein